MRIAYLHFDSAVGLTTADFDIEILVKQTTNSFRPANFTFDIAGSLANSNGTPIFLRLAPTHNFSGISGTSVFGFDNDTYAHFTIGDYSSVKLFLSSLL